MPRDPGAAGPGDRTWLDFFSAGDHVYVYEVNQEGHFRFTAGQMVALVPGPHATVLDYGPGEALFAPLVAEAAGHLILCEAADDTRQRLARRFAGADKITVIGEPERAALPDESVDLIVVNSVIQYLTPDELDKFLHDANRLLKPGGQILISDVIPRSAGMIAETVEFLRAAARGRYLRSAVWSLVQTVLSPYRRFRNRLGLSCYDELEMIAKLAVAGLPARRHRPNLSYNQGRMAFLATRP